MHEHPRAGRLNRVAVLLVVGALAPMSPLCALAKSSAGSSVPDFGPNVIVFDPSMPQAEMQTRIDEIATAQQKAEYGPGRYAILFKPGSYSLDVKVAFSTQVAGLGLSPDDVTIHGHVQSLSIRGGWSVLVSFWRSAENMCVIPPDGADRWAVSQAAPYRRMHVRGNLLLTENGPGSGGFIADSKIDGTVEAASQQQWLTRDSSIQGWNGGLWNIVFVGVNGAPPTSQEPVQPPSVSTRARTRHQHYC